MCRNIKTLHNFKPPATEDEIRASSLQFVRKLSGFTRPSKTNQIAFERAVDQVAAAAHELLDSLVTDAPPRYREVEAAKADGRWAAAYDSPTSATVPQEFLDALARNKRANACYVTLNKANLYAIAYRLQTAKKPETKQRRMETIIAMLARGEKFH